MAIENIKKRQVSKLFTKQYNSHIMQCFELVQSKDSR